MSFLAKLRQQTPDSSGSQMQLSFLLRIVSGRIQLRLALLDIGFGQVRSEPTPYRIQQQHLISPPPFFSPGDDHRLRKLLQIWPFWSGADELDLSDSLTKNAFMDILTSHRAFAQNSPRSWSRLNSVGTLNLELRWHINAMARQTLHWSGLHQAETFALADGYGMQSKTGDIVFIEHPIQLTEFASWFGKSLDPLQVPTFLVDHELSWQRLGLPLPRLLEPQTCVASSLDVVLRCCKHGPQNRLVLQLRLITAEFSLPLNYSECQDPIYLWDGCRVQQFSVDAAWLLNLYQTLNEWLGDFHRADDGVWYSNKASVWRYLLLEKKFELETLAIAVEVDPGFEFHFVEVEQWQVSVQATDQGTMQLQLFCQTAGISVNLLPLLADLMAMGNLAGQSGELSLKLDNKILVLPEKLCGLLREEFADLIAWQKINRPIPLNQLYRLSRLDQLLPEASWLDEHQLLQRAQQLRARPTLPNVQASGIKAELRSYQWLGVCWLQHLHKLNMNGLLADDMGLGKTLQTLSLLSVQFHLNPNLGPALIVAPTSLLNNWASEIQKFCPHLQFAVVHGNQRHALWTHTGKYQILITSYHLLVNDLADWQAHTLSWLILDEAQYIKNPRTQISRAVRQIAASHRLCLTGTPVENHLSELWSIMDFLEPGILGSHKQFRDYYQKPIEEDLLAPRMQQLLDRLEPVMLRRTKQQVAKDLPEKTLIPRTIAFTDEQAELYQNIREQGWTQVQETLASGMPEGQKHMQLMTALVRLRQVCCDPELIGETVSSAKTQTCLDMVEELVGEGRALLIFSQFTSMLSILARRLDQLTIPYFKLTGSSRNRAEMVDGFQRGERPVFLISLKAGGVGLNLTRADTVIHFDPWWNAAAEQQASDRVHRIGQTQPVFVYKLIMANSIEEKIARLQLAKASLSEHIHQRAQRTGETFALNLRELIELWKEPSL